jgi:hypothetical protein
VQVGDLIRIKPEHCEDSHNTWSNAPPDSQWVGLVTGVYEFEEMIEVMWSWSGTIVSEYTEHLEVICK